MHIHEYQAKQLLNSYGIAVPPGGVAATAEEAEAVARSLSGPSWVVKAQIRAGGRGPAGGVKIVHSLEDAKAAAGLMLGSQLATAQTTAEGEAVKRVYIEKRCDIVHSFYLALLVDTTNGCLTLLVSPEPGSESIEQLAATHPEKVIKCVFHPDRGLSQDQARELASSVGLTGEQATVFERYARMLSETFVNLDASLIEISPLVVTDTGEFMALDAKLSFDDNALFRHPTIKALQDQEGVDPTELAAAQQGLNYIRLNGNIGTMVSGAGLAMATLDAIVECGGRPANFLDVPPMARQAQVAAAVKLLLGDGRLGSILVNVFGGGLMRCDTIADGIIVAVRDTHITVPLVVRLSGTNADIGKKALRGAGLKAVFADDLAGAAQNAVQAAQATHSSPATASSTLLGSMKKMFSKEDD